MIGTEIHELITVFEVETKIFIFKNWDPFLFFKRHLMRGDHGRMEVHV
jgi:hypothetical protein